MIRTGRVAMKWRRWGVAIAGLAMLVGTVQASSLQRTGLIDARASWAGFSLRTRWGQTLDGHFPDMRGEILAVAGERRQVRVTLSTASVEIVGSTRYTRLTRSEGFFDAERHPEVEFVSDPYPQSLVHEGGKLAGQLTIRGRTRREVFTLAPSSCDRPGVDCDIFATGVVYRGDFAMDRWAVALSDRVRLTLRLRTRGEGG